MEKLMKSLFAVIVLGLVAALAPRALGAGETNHNFAQWEREIAAFEQSDRTNPPPKGAILFLGSSTIRFWTTLAADFPHHQVINRGFGGSEIADSTHFADRIVFPYAPRAIFFRAGGNDLANGKSPTQVFADFEAFVKTVHARLPATDIYFMAWNATPSRWQQHDQEQAMNEMVAAFARRTPHVKYVDDYALSLGPDGKPRPELFRPDRLHFNAEGYKLLAEKVRPYLPQ
jgi:lysophospholipase L1-like esterase